MESVSPEASGAPFIPMRERRGLQARIGKKVILGMAGLKREMLLLELEGWQVMQDLGSLSEL